MLQLHLLSAKVAAVMYPQYRNNQLNAFDVLLNGRSYTFDLPAYTNGYQVKTASTYNRAGNGIANVFTTNVITEAIVNNTSLRVTVNMTQPTSVAASKLRAMQQSGQVTLGEVSTCSLIMKAMMA